MPHRHRSVLVAVDGSPESELAVMHAVALAHANHVRLELVAVVPPPPLLASRAPGGMRAAHESEHAELTRNLRAAADLVPDELRVTTRLIDGDPARELVRAARDGAHDVILIGSHGRGRVADHVVREAGVTVIVFHLPESDDDPDLAA